MNKRALMLSAATIALLSGSALADTDITTKITSPINTQTDGDITIESNGSVIITTSSPTVAAVTVNSNAIVNNEGQISYNGVTDATGVELVTGFTGEYEMTGKLTLTGSGTAKTGILISGASSNINSGTFTGVIASGSTTPVAINIEADSTVSVQGDNSYGIDQFSGTNIVGDIDIAGAVNVLGSTPSPRTVRARDPPSTRRRSPWMCSSWPKRSCRRRSISPIETPVSGTSTLMSPLHAFAR